MARDGDEAAGLIASVERKDATRLSKKVIIAAWISFLSITDSPQSQFPSLGLANEFNKQWLGQKQKKK